MKKFADNLQSFMKSTGFSYGDIVELAQLSPKEFDLLLNGEPTLDIYYKFCVELEIEFTSIWSDSGFQTSPLYSQYAKYPVQYKKIVTKAFLKALAKAATKFTLKNDQERLDILREILQTNMPESRKLISRFFSESSHIEVDMLPNIQKALSNVLSEDAFKQVLGKVMYSKIINYNYNIAKDYFNLSYDEIGQYLKMPKGSVSNWGGKYCSSIPARNVKKLVKGLGNFSEEEFRSRFLDKNDFEGRSCELSLGAKLPDIPKDDTPGEMVQSQKSTKKPKTIKKEVCTNEIKPQESESSVNNDLSITVTDDMMIKMLNQLSPSEVAHVKSIIVQLFFAKL